MKKFIFLIFMTCSCYAQEIYIVNNLTQLKVIDIQNFTVTNLFTLNINTQDLAFTPDGRLFGISSIGQIFEIDLTNQTYNIVTTIPGGDFFTGLVSNNNFELITSATTSENLYVYNVNTTTLSLLSGGVSTPGDFTYYKGNLIYPDYENTYIKAFDGMELKNIGCSLNQLYSFVNVFEDCETEKIYGIDGIARIYLFDLELETVEEVASLGPITGNIFGGATTSEYMSSNCPQIDLNTVICSLSNPDNSYKTVTVYPNPTSDEITLNSTINLDNIKYYIMDLSGKIIKTNILNSKSISLKELSTGFYILVLKSSEGEMVFNERIIKN
ncbi:MAG: T9SS type A sorting domain-containing protein [Aequorivita sp.]|nr:T9SS type A sorting domain-containing protein [Aequorivita sp.]